MLYLFTSGNHIVAWTECGGERWGVVRDGGQMNPSKVAVGCCEAGEDSKKI